MVIIILHSYQFAVKVQQLSSPSSLPLFSNNFCKQQQKFHPFTIPAKCFFTCVFMSGCCPELLLNSQNFSRRLPENFDPETGLHRQRVKVADVDADVVNVAVVVFAIGSIFVVHFWQVRNLEPRVQSVSDLKLIGTHYWNRILGIT